MKLVKPIRWRGVIALVLGLCVAGFGAVSAVAQSTAKKTTSAKKTSTAKKKKKTSARTKRVRGQKAPTADRISEIQKALAKDGSYGGEPTGKWDANTVEAMRKFQAGHGMNPSGKLDAISLQKLGLGSKTAGVAAPYKPETSAPGSTAAESSSGNSGERQR